MLTRPGAPAVLLDRDGTIIVERRYLSDAAMIAFEAGAVSGLRRLQQAGFILVVLTNQSGVGRGYFDLATAEAVNAQLYRLLKAEGVNIRGWYICPHRSEDRCACRKPLPGMARQAALDLGLGLAASWVVGDKRSDALLADAIGAQGILVATGHGAADVDWARSNGKHVAQSLADAAEQICSA